MLDMEAGGLLHPSLDNRPGSYDRRDCGDNRYDQNGPIATAFGSSAFIRFFGQPSSGEIIRRIVFGFIADRHPIGEPMPNNVFAQCV